MKQHRLRWELAAIDAILLLLSCIFILVVYPTTIDYIPRGLVVAHTAVAFLCVFIPRLVLNIYGQIWRYAGPKEYILLLVSDAVAAAAFVLVRYWLPHKITFVRAVSLIMMNLLLSIAIRHMYQLIYQKRTSGSRMEKAALAALRFLTGRTFGDEEPERNRIRVAIVGAGSVGAMLADELLQNPKAAYEPVCFVDIDEGKIGRVIYGIPVIPDGSPELLSGYKVQVAVFALPNLSVDKRKELYEQYKAYGYSIKTYDYPTLDSDVSGKRRIHDFAIEDLLFRPANHFLNEQTKAWYSGKAVMITGGGGSIGSELARQIARCAPSRLMLLDVYENGVYDIQQELRIKYGDELNLRVEIANVCDAEQIDKIFRDHTPDVVLHAAAHKHVPLMERNVIEAVKNNVFGTLNVVEACERHGVKRFIMVSTDKAVNPTNVMGATKRMCEMIVQSRGGGITSFSATRFGNVLGSNGSVIPLFKRQIANGGPITITDRRIIRYFMTIPEACQLVMTSGAMAGNGELYVLDMGDPVKILDLAENMVKLSGLEPYKDIDIIETGLRPGEKLYEELLIKTEQLDKTDNDMIFVERDTPLAKEAIAAKLDLLRRALATQSNRAVREALMEAVPTYHTPEEVNERAIASEEMQKAAGA